MTRTLLRSLIVALVAIALTATSADAEIWRHRDGRGDAFRVEYADNGSAVNSIDPANENSDVTRLVVRHRARAVLIDFHLRDLQEVGNANAVVNLQTDRARYQALATFGQDDPGSVMLFRGRPLVSCGRMWARFRPDKDKVRVRLPRTCLADPAWVRVRGMFRWFDVSESGSVDQSFYDYPLVTGEDTLPPTWSPRLQPSLPPPPEPLTFYGGYGWSGRRPVGGTMTDAMAILEIGAARGVVIEHVRAKFDSGVRTIGKRFAPPDRATGGALVHEWPLDASYGPMHSIPARGAHLTPTGSDGGWLLILGYRVTRPGRHLRPTIRIDYRVGDQHFTLRSETPGLICAGREERHRPCEFTPEELGRNRLISSSTSG